MHVVCGAYGSEECAHMRENARQEALHGGGAIRRPVEVTAEAPMPQSRGDWRDMQIRHTLAFAPRIRII